MFGRLPGGASGIVPVKSFPSKYMSVKLVVPAYKFGIGPVKVLLDRYNACSAGNSKRYEPSVPESTFMDKSRYVSAVLPLRLGMDPVKLFS